MTRSRWLAKLGTAGVATGTATTTALSGYLALLTVAGARPHRPTAPPGPAQHRCVVLIPAHDEAAVIGRTLDALDHIDYPRRLFDVHVVADNCSDRTAEIVEISPWHVHRRHDPDDPGKGAALNWLFGRLDADPNVEFDIVVIVDADTVVDPQFLRHVDGAFSRGAEVVQGHYAALAPDSAPSIALRSAALAARHHLRPLGRMRLGGSCGLFGNGMAFDPHLVRAHPWTGHLVEDAQLQLRLLLEGHDAHYVPSAVVEAEIPDSLQGSQTQHRRWELGRLQLIGEFALPLVRGVARSRGRRLAHADALADLLTPPLSVLLGSQIVLSLASGIGAVAGSARHRRLLCIDVVAATVVVAHVLIALQSVSAPRSTYRALLGAPKAIVWKIGTWVGVLARPDRVSWQRTGRNEMAS